MFFSIDDSVMMMIYDRYADCTLKRCECAISSMRQAASMLVNVAVRDLCLRDEREEY